MAGAASIKDYIGSKVSLISASDVRYEGCLYTIDPEESTVALQRGEQKKKYKTNRLILISAYLTSTQFFTPKFPSSHLFSFYTLSWRKKKFFSHSHKKIFASFFLLNVFFRCFSKFDVWEQNIAELVIKRFLHQIQHMNLSFFVGSISNLFTLLKINVLLAGTNKVSKK